MEVFYRWFAEGLDSGTHSAACWVMRQRSYGHPMIQPTPQPSRECAWWYTPMKLTKVKIPAGSAGGDVGTIVIKETFWLSDREISMGLFKQFMAEAKDKPNDWQGAYPFENNIADKHPVQQVSWEDAVMFCNWLSEKHGLDKCNEIEPVSEPMSSQKYNVKMLRGDGFRLPTADEWEYSCRANTTQFFCGNDTNVYFDTLYSEHTGPTLAVPNYVTHGGYLICTVMFRSGVGMKMPRKE